MMEVPAPQISVYVPTRNRHALAMRAIASVLAQDFVALEVVVVDDGSDTPFEECSLQIATDRNLRVIRLPQRRGAPFARNTAIEAATSSLVIGLDDDDMFLPGRLNRLWDLALRHPDQTYASCDLICHRGRVKTTRRPLIARQADLRCANVIGNQVLAPKELYKQAGLFDISLKAAQDHEMWSRLLGGGIVCHIDPRPGQIIDFGHSAGQISGNLDREISYSIARRLIGETIGPDKTAAIINEYLANPARHAFPLMSAVSIMADVSLSWPVRRATIEILLRRAAGVWRS